MDLLSSFVGTFLNLLSSAAPWILLSFLSAAVFHEVASLGWIKRRLRRGGTMPHLYSSIAGILTPAWGSSVIPVGISLSQQGGRQGIVLGYIIAAIAINPIALPMAYGLIGTEFTVALLLTVLLGPTLFGFLYDVVSVGHPSPLPVVEGPGAATAIQLEEFEDDTLYQRLQAGLKYSFGSLLVSTAPWLVLGFALGSIAKLLISIAPDSIVSQYFADPGITPLLVAAGFAAITYIWGVGSIPFVASLVTMGLAPGAALVILTFGSASNLSCIVPALRFFGKRLTVMLVLSSLTMSVTGGYLLNLWMAPTLEIRAMMRPSWTLADSGGGSGVVLPDCWGGAIDSIGQLGQEASPTAILTAAWDLFRSGIFLFVSFLMVWGTYKSASNLIRARRSGRIRAVGWGVFPPTGWQHSSIVLYDIVIFVY